MKKNSLQLYTGVLLVVAGIALIAAGLLIPPGGEIHPSVLVAFGEIATFAAALMGVDYHYKYRIHELESKAANNNENE